MTGVVIVHFGDRSVTQRCEDSLRHAGAEKIHVVDNSRINIGYGAACNKGFDKLEDCERVIFINNDTTVAPDFIKRMDEVTADYVCPQVTDPQGHIIYAGGHIDISGAHHHKMIESPLPFPTQYIYGCCVMVRRKTFDRYDENYFLYYEDVDLTRRTKGSIVCQPQAVVVHHHDNYRKADDPVIRYYATRNYPRAMKGHPGVLPYYFFYFVPGRLAYFAIGRNWTACGQILKGMGDYLKGKTGK